jgi:hypothetical protein
VAQLGECDSERGTTLGIVKSRSHFGFCGRGDHVFDDGSDIEDGPVKCFLLGGLVSEEKQTSETTSCVGDREVRGVAVDVQYHVRGVISNGGVRVSCQVVQHFPRFVPWRCH